MKQSGYLPKVLVNSLPKSGTHLLLQIILGIPGMKITPSWIITKKDLDLFESSSVGPAHFEYRPDFIKLLKEHNIKVIYISRDLRDVAVSLVHFVMLNKWGNHPWTPYLKDLKTHDERLLTMIKGVKLTQDEQKKYGITHIPSIKEFSEDKLGWLYEPNILSITFEDLVYNEESQNRSIMKIIDYLWFDLMHLNMTKEELLQRIKQNIIPENSGTFRKGKIGDWREEFNMQHKEVFKTIAGDLLIKLGYEKDHNW